MAKFLIQTIDSQVRHDWSFALMEAIDYQNWLHKGSHEYELCEINKMFEYDYSDHVPSGTIQFVSYFLEFYHRKTKRLKPINIPSDLRSLKYLKRLVFYGDNDKISKLGGKAFIKSNDVLKGLAEIMDCEAIKNCSQGNYVASEIVEIDSEWRAFVYNNELVGIQNYLGDFTMMPDIDLIKQMISECKNCPPAYSLDVMVNEHKGTMILECHNIYSTGFYGFSRNDIIPQMMVRCFNHLLQKGW